MTMLIHPHVEVDPRSSRHASTRLRRFTMTLTLVAIGLFGATHLGGCAVLAGAAAGGAAGYVAGHEAGEEEAEEEMHDHHDVHDEDVHDHDD